MSAARRVPTGTDASFVPGGDSFFALHGNPALKRWANLGKIVARESSLLPAEAALVLFGR